MKYKTKKILTYVGIALVFVLLLTLIISLISNLFTVKSKDDYTKVDAKWSVGGIDVSGTFDDNMDTRLTSTFIDIDKGLKFIMKEDKDFRYTVYLYDEDKQYIGIFEPCEDLNKNYSCSLDDILSVCPDAEYIRVTIYNLDEDDNHFDWFEKLKYSSYLEVFVTDKEQNEN